MEEVTSIGDLDPEDVLFPIGNRTERVEVEMRPSLTAEAIPLLQPRQSEYTVWDGAVKGLGLRVRTSGWKSFVFYLRTPTAGLKKITIGAAKDIDLEAAREAARELRHKARVLDDYPG